MPIKFNIPPEIDRSSNAYQFITALIAAAIVAKDKNIKPHWNVLEEEAMLYNMISFDHMFGIKFEFAYDSHYIWRFSPIFDPAEMPNDNEVMIKFKDDNNHSTTLENVPSTDVFSTVISEMDYETYFSNYSATYWLSIINEMNDATIINELSTGRAPIVTNELDKFFDERPILNKNKKLTGFTGLYLPSLVGTISTQNSKYYNILRKE